MPRLHCFDLAVFVRFLGMRQEHMGSGAFLTPEPVPMQIGKLAILAERAN